MSKKAKAAGNAAVRKHFGDSWARQESDFDSSAAAILFGDYDGTCRCVAGSAKKNWPFFLWVPNPETKK
jgi:hypothetical protein